MMTSRQIAVGIGALTACCLAMWYAGTAGRAGQPPAPITVPELHLPTLDEPTFSESVEERVPALLGCLHRGDRGFEDLLAQILSPDAPWQRLVTGGTREYLKVISPGEQAQVFTTGVLMVDSRRDGQRDTVEWDAFHRYWDGACMRDADIALRTGEILFEVNEKSGVALQRLAKNLLVNADPGCRRASFMFLARRASGETMGYDPLLPGQDWTQQRREIRLGRPAYACAEENVEPGKRWVEWARQQEAGAR